MSDHPIPSRFMVGIDLGTTNSAVAFVDSEDPSLSVRVFRVPQLVAPGETEARDTLPSFLYQPLKEELTGTKLPWSAEETEPYAVGIWARDQGAASPGRLVVSAKSWLSHSGVDRTAPLLPWHGSPEVSKLSPMEASSRYLAHIRAAWNHSHPKQPLEAQDVVITIPASFDEIARELTVESAKHAGIPRVVLLEEPQAAFYAWVNRSRNSWDKLVRAGQKILVCDVGGGTTDFTLIQVQKGESEEIRFHRFAVGDHLILGGDNLDLALAHFVEQRIGGKLNAGQWSVLIRKCQQAKETLLGPAAPKIFTLSIPPSGSRLIGSALQLELSREEILAVLLEGFLPRVPLDAKPLKHASGFREFGLPYASDPAITRYLAAFLTSHRHTVASSENSSHDPARPDIILFNGGLFESSLMRQRLIEVAKSWFQGGSEWSPLVLENERLDLAVAIGAAYYGLVRRGVGIRISGGLPRSYYIGVESGEHQVALCLVPAGLEEGRSIDLPDRKFDLLIRQPVEFPIYISASRTVDKPGSLVEIDLTQLKPLPSIRTVLKSGKQTGRITVELHARLTEIGTLEVWCSEVKGQRTWKLQFDVRAATHTDIQPHVSEAEQLGFLDEQTVAKCHELISQTFETSTPPENPERVVKRMEEAIGLGRFEWPPSLLRSCWEKLMEVESGRRQSVIHEAKWLNFLGFCLRPGFGFAVDDWRVAQTWRIHENKVLHPKNELCRSEWWILWRRIAGGLVAGQQRVLAEPLLAQLKRQMLPPQDARKIRTGQAAWGAHELAEVWRLLGSLELLNTDTKIQAGNLLLQQIQAQPKASWIGATLWALGRIGARVPLYGPLNTLLPPDALEQWLDQLLHMPVMDHPQIPFTLVQMGRLTGDRFRDVSDEMRSRILGFLQKSNAPSHYVELVRVGGTLETRERDEVFGEKLPAGLQLAS